MAAFRMPPRTSALYADRPAARPPAAADWEQDKHRIAGEAVDADKRWLAPTRIADRQDDIQQTVAVQVLNRRDRDGALLPLGHDRQRDRLDEGNIGGLELGHEFGADAKRTAGVEESEAQIVEDDACKRCHRSARGRGRRRRGSRYGDLDRTDVEGWSLGTSNAALVHGWPGGASGVDDRAS